MAGSYRTAAKANARHVVSLAATNSFGPIKCYDDDDEDGGGGGGGCGGGGDVKNLSLGETTSNSFTVTWKLPEGMFDYYVVCISANDNDSTGNAQRNITGSCANATLIPRDQTQLTCDNMVPCSNVTIEMRTYSAGPPEHTSMGVALRNIFIPGDEPLPPFGITVTSISSSQTLLRWQPPPKVSGVITGYIVQICNTFAVCDSDENVRGCTEHRTSETFLEAETTADSSYCILVIAIVQCGVDLIGSPPAAQQLRTPPG
ncbi:hypothetical protein HPB50_022450 [Hyalomma asiaticum]|uniref:Uncharacterized protein n=1 Tax=Hyalomma asiaticum TaxID=266040 RepID=A0ACB7RSN1_HYAAI|nr:hypothetical protein HPB50_022450 [Hyalomma asiaticum]